MDLYGYQQQASSSLTWYAQIFLYILIKSEFKKVLNFSKAQNAFIWPSAEKLAIKIQFYVPEITIATNRNKNDKLY